MGKAKRRSRQASGFTTILWFLAFIACTFVALRGWLDPLNLSLSQLLRPLARAVPDLNLIWVVGSVPVTAALLLLWVWSKGRWRQLWLFAGGVLLEVITKHFVASPLPHPLGEPSWIGRLEGWVNPSPQWVITAIKQRLGMVAATGSGAQFFRGSFFSGHVFRLTYLTGALAGIGRPGLLVLVGLVAGILVVALGGHWALDALGGFCLARALLGADSYFRRKR